MCRLGVHSVKALDTTCRSKRRSLFRALRQAMIGILLLFLILMAGSASAATYYVAPDGDDGNPGTIDQPFATVEKARDTIRGTTGNTVYLRGGKYWLDSALAFISADSGTDGAPNIYKAYPDESVVLSGGQLLEATWEPVEHLGNSIYKTNVGDLFFRSMWVDDAKAQRARTPNGAESMADYEYFTSQTTPAATQAIGFSEGDIDPTWTNLQEVEIQFVRDFTSRRQRISSVDDVNNVVWMAGNAYSGGFVQYYSGNRYWVENVFEGLDAPGEWYLNTDSNDLYYYPIDGKNPNTSEIMVGRLGVTSTQNQGILIDNNGADYLEFYDLTFAHTDWYIPFETTGWDGFSIEFVFTGPMVYLRGGVDGTRFEHCTFKFSGGHGLYLYQGSHNTVSYCTLTDIGGIPLRIGYESSDGSLTAYNTVSDCTISGYGGQFPSIGKGIVLGTTSHCDVRHNYVSEGSYMGIQIGRNISADIGAGNNTLEYNHLYDTAQILTDCAALYSTGQQTDSVYRYNKVHGLRMGLAIYPDDHSNGITFERNLVYDCYWGVLTRGVSATIQNNIFASMREEGYAYIQWVTRSGLPIQHNIFYHTPLLFYSFGISITDACVLDKNLYYDATGGQTRFTRYDWTWNTTLNNLTSWGLETNGVFNQDPLFVDPENHDYRLQSNSPALLPVGSGGIGFVCFADEIAKVGPRAVSSDEINRAPVFASIGEKSVNEGALLSFSVSATDADGDALIYSARALPAGATFSGQTFSWTPGYDQAGTYQVTFVVSDGKVEDFETIAIEVADVPTGSDPVLQSIGDKGVDEGQSLSFSIHATDPDGDEITYAATGLPSGASFVGDTFSWTPDYGQAGTYPVTFTASDGQGSDSEQITITVRHVNRPPVLAAVSDRSVDEGSLLSFSIQASDPDGDAIALSAENLPSGATFSSVSFSWTPSPSQVGTYQVTFIASDGHLTDTATIAITVLASEGDADGPVVVHCSPGADAIQAPINSLIALAITDADPGVDAATVTIAVNGATVYSGDIASYSSAYGVCRRMGTKNAYAYAFQANSLFDYDRQIDVLVSASDLADNAMSPHSYSFRTEMRSFGANRIASWGPADLNKSRPATVRDSSGNIWVVYHAGPPGTRDVYIAKLTHGTDFFGGISAALTPGTADHACPDIAIGSDDRLTVVWQDNRRGTWDIYARTSTDGVTWSTETRVTDNDDNQTRPAIAADPQSSAVWVAWQDDGAGHHDIYAARSTDGFTTKTISQITAHASHQIDPKIAVTASGTATLVWTDQRNGSDDVYAAASDVGPWMNVAAVAGPGNQSAPALAAEAAGSRLHLAWVDDTSGSQDIHYAASDGLPGSPLVGVNVVDDLSGADQIAPVIATVGSTGAGLKIFIAWQDYRNYTDGRDTDLYFIEFRAGPAANILVGDARSNADQTEPALGIDLYGHPYLVWTDHRNVESYIFYAASTFMAPSPLQTQLVTGSAGGTVGVTPPVGLDDVSIVVPAGACPHDVTLAIRPIENPPWWPIMAYDFGPSGLQFNGPVILTIPYLPSDYGDEQPIPYWYDSLTGTVSQQGIAVVDDLDLGPDLRALRFTVTHFTPYYLLPGDGSYPGDADDDGGDDDGGWTSDGGGGGGGGCSLASSAQSNPLEFFAPYLLLAVVMAALRLRDRRRHSHGS